MLQKPSGPNGVQRAGGSNPLAPTNKTKGVANFWFPLFFPKWL